MIHIIREKATLDQIRDMLQMLQAYIKLAVDIDRDILSGGGAMPNIWKDADARKQLAEKSDVWSKQILEISGLLK